MRGDYHEIKWLSHTQGIFVCLCEITSHRKEIHDTCTIQGTNTETNYKNFKRTKVRKKTWALRLVFKVWKLEWGEREYCDVTWSNRFYDMDIHT